MKITLLIISLTIFAQISLCQQELDLNKIMAGNEFIGYQPTDICWSPNSTHIYFRWKRENETVAPYYSYSLSEKKYKKLNSDEQLLLPVEGFESDNNLEPFYYKKGNRLFKWNATVSQLLYTKQNRFSLFKIIGKNLIIIRENDNLFLVNTLNAQFRQLTNFQNGTKPDRTTEENFLINQQEELFEIIKTENKRTEDRTNYAEQNNFKELSSVYLEGKTLSWMSINNQLTQLVFCLDKYPDDKVTHIEEYVTADGYSNSVSARPKVGSENPTHEIFVWDLINDTTFKLSVDHLTDIKKKPEFLEEYSDENFDRWYQNPKKTIPHEHGFNDVGDKCIIEIKSYDNKDRWLVFYDTLKKKLIEFEYQHDAKWIGGPGISGWKGEAGNVGWINNHTTYFQSEKSGYSHLYSCDFDGVKKDNTYTQLTSGEFEIHQATLAKDKTKFFISANKNHPGNREFYLLDIATKKLTPILTNDGNYEVFVSPDEKWLAVNYSYKNKPWELQIAPLKENTTLTKITKSTTTEFDNYKWRAPEVIAFKAQDGKTIYARIYEPTAENKNGAGVLFVHGAGYLQNAHNWWSSYHREFMFNNLLADLGYTVLDIDYRASEGYGRDFRTDIYRHMGGKDLSDHLDGRKLLIEKYGIDSTRVGLYGGSYGGFITLMAMLTEPGKFKCGAALRSVTDWAHYNHDYTANILNTPEEDSIAYRRSSPIYFAEGLQGRLLMLHGMEDDNVQFQDVVRLSQRFIELKKMNWDLIGYPIEPHGFVETTSWIDEYRRILEMFEEELNVSN